MPTLNALTLVGDAISTHHCFTGATDLSSREAGKSKHIHKFGMRL